MALLVRIYFNAVFGALGGLLGWMLFGIFGDKHSSSLAQQLLGGAFIGGFIGYFVVGVDALRDRSLLRFCRLASYGVVLGAAGGALGMPIGEGVNYYLVRGLVSWQEGGASLLRISGEVVSRAMGWMLLGLSVGLSEGIAARSLGKLSYGALGGTIGGFVGGALFGLIKVLEKGSAEGTNHIWVGAFGLVILGACIGALSALVQGVFQPASVRVLRGWQEGREYPLVKMANLLGRDEGADIALFRDMRVEKRHAIIQREGNHFVLFHHEGPAENTRINGEPVSSHHLLQDGDRIQLGNILLRFQRRAAAEKLKKV
jgi:Inner membrane component of T3SS, cytoplasmic domain